MLDENDLVTIEFCLNKVADSIEKEFDDGGTKSVSDLVLFRKKHLEIIETLEKVRKM